MEEDTEMSREEGITDRGLGRGRKEEERRRGEKTRQGRRWREGDSGWSARWKETQRQTGKKA